jgi:putative ABC transport system permease protein
VSRRVYRALLRLYPREFRARFGRDLEYDAQDMLRDRGAIRGWARLLIDLARAIVPAHRHARVARRHTVQRFGHEEGSMGSLLFDLRHACRTLVKAPVFTAVTILTLALGIGANSAIFSLVNAVLLRPTGYEQPERLMLIYEGIPRAKLSKMTVSPPDYLDLTAYQRSFSAIGAYRGQLYELSGGAEPEMIQAARITAGVFPILGVQPMLGRGFLASEEQPGHTVVILGHGLWQRRFAGRLDVLGQTITLDRRPHTIVGVMPASFQFPKRGPQRNGEPAALWTPLSFAPFEREARGMMYNHSVIGRLRDGLTPEQAAAEVSALAPRIQRNYPAVILQSGFSIVMSAEPLLEEIAGEVRRPLLILLGAVGLVLLIACANVANLVLSRAVTRQREIGVRAALGAGRWRLAQLLLTESVVLAGAGGILGVLIGHWTVRAMPTVIATSLPGVEDVTLDLRVVAFALAISALTAVVFGIMPLLAGDRRDLNESLRDGSTRATSGRRQHRVQGGLVVSSVAFAVLLLVGAGLLIRSFNTLMAVDTGVRSARVLTAQVALPPATYTNAAAVRPFYQNLYDRVRAIPGVRAASIATDVPLRPDGERRAFTADRADDTGGPPASTAVTWIHGDYFRSYGIPLIKGRTFLPDEIDQDRRVAIVSRAMADQSWPGQDPIGKRIKWGGRPSQAPWMTVVGVAGDVVDGKLGEEPVVHIYAPFVESADIRVQTPVMPLLRRMVIATLADGEPATLVDGVRRAVASLDPALAVSDVATLTEIVADASAPQRFSTMVLGAFAGGALLLAAVGLYGVMAFGVAQRTREFGVRFALGATRRDVVALILRQGMTLALIGAVLGLAGAFVATRLMTTLLYETSAFDPLTFAVVPVLLVTVALVACYVPARRAARVEPMTALRTE